jgi:hypothetical protein
MNVLPDLPDRAPTEDVIRTRRAPTTILAPLLGHRTGKGTIARGGEREHPYSARGAWYFRATEAAREAFRSKFEHDVDPDGVLPVDERLRRAEMARKAHFTRLALRSAQVRRQRRERSGKPRRPGALDESARRTRSRSRRSRTGATSRHSPRWPGEGRGSSAPMSHRCCSCSRPAATRSRSRSADHRTGSPRC